MSLSLTKASTQYLQALSAVRSADPLAVSCWIRPTDVSTAATIWSIGSSSSANNFWEGAFNNSAVLRARKVKAVFSGSATSGTVLVDTWQHVAFEFDNAATTPRRRSGLNGVFGSAQDTDVADPTVDRTVIGALMSGGSISLPFGGYIAEFAMFSAIPSASQWALLAAGRRPHTVGVALVDYWPLLNSADSAVGGTDLTAVNGATFDAGVHPAMVEDAGSASRLLLLNGRRRR
jgi:hypothetical protein